MEKGIGTEKGEEKQLEITRNKEIKSNREGKRERNPPGSATNVSREGNVLPLSSYLQTPSATSKLSKNKTAITYFTINVPA